MVAACLFGPLATQAVAEAKQVEIVVNGVDDELQKNVLAHLSLNRLATGSKPQSANAVRRLYKRVEDEVATALQAYGYYQPTVAVDLQELEAWSLTLTIKPGDQVQLRNVVLELRGQGRDEASLNKIVNKSSLRAGVSLSHAEYETYKSSMRSRAYAIGYLDAQFTKHELRVFPGQARADVVLSFDTGERYFFGPITVQQDTLNPEFVQRFVKPRQGDPFEGAKLIQMQLALSETNYFSGVSIDVQREAVADFQIPVTVTAEPRKAAKYDFSLGFGTDTGPRVGIGADFRRVNRRGHRFKNQLQVSSVASTLASQYIIPIGDVSSEFLDFSANVEQEKVNEVDVTEYRIGSSLNQNRWGGRRRLGLDLTHENWAFGDNPSNTATLLVPSIDFTKKNADDPFFARRGYSGTVRLLGGVEDVGSDVSFMQLQLFAKAVLPLFEQSRLLLRGEFGATTTDVFDALPPSLRFFAGGAQSVRGYGYKDLSPTDLDGNRTGGKYLAAVSAEVDYMVYNNIGVALFVDAGDATRQPLQSLKVGAGLGFRYRSPVGMLRIDLAHPFDDPDNDFRVHLSFGIDL